ncbi:MAG: TetR/AcrR family transcriptional regulator [Pseudomonadota bacterium]
MSQSQRMSHAERTDLSDRRMLDAAIALIVERGTDKTTLKEVGERAGYSRGLAGYRFGSKAGLFETIVRDVGEQWLSDLKRVTAGKSGLAAIDAAVDEHCRFCLEAVEPVRAFYILWFESIGVQSPVKNVIATIAERRSRDIVSWLGAAGYRGATPPEGIAAQFNATVLGIVYHWLANPDDRDGTRTLHEQLKNQMALNLADRPAEEMS